MNLQNKRILLTGATGGIGQELAHQLASRQITLVITGRNPDTLKNQADILRNTGTHVCAIAADITCPEDRQRLYNEVYAFSQGIDILINNAGAMDFCEFTSQSYESIDRIINTNITSPMYLTHIFLPDMIKKGEGRIVNNGSVFGTMGFPCFVSYSTSKFALRGFSESLRRELRNTGVGITHVSPRAVRTGLNPETVYRMSEEMHMNFDAPDIVARHIIRAIEKQRNNCYIGFPESLFARFNSIFPGLVDRVLSKQSRILKEYARQY